MKRISKTLNYILFSFKKILKPLVTIIKYPNVDIYGKVSIVGSCIENNVKIYDRTVISNTTIEKYSYVGSNCKIMNTKIGKFCSLGSNLKIGLGIHPTNYISTYPGFYSNKASGSHQFHIIESEIEHKRIIIKNDVWIGDGATIVDGVIVGNGAIIATGSVVTKDVPDYAIVGGVPAKIIKYRFSEDKIEELLKIKWWDKEENYIKQKAELFTDTESFFLKF